ncbi:MAG TPA: DUF6585 family protein [Umezawaea sp.]|nr:DUF6585 family protein [Umezawaea sp.]
MRGTSSEPAPDRVVTAAGAANLGTLLAHADAPRVREFAAIALTVALTVIPSGAAVWLSLELDLPAGVAAVLIVGLLFGAPLTALLVLNRRSRRQVFYLFERGAVLNRPSKPAVKVLLWADLLPYERIRTFGVGQSATPRDEWSLVVRDSSGETVFIGFGAESIRLAEAMAEVELSRAKTVLAGGEHLRYGPFTVTVEELAVEDRTLPWTEVGQVKLNGYSVEVIGKGTSAEVVERQPRRRTPHQRTLVALAHELTGERSTL